MAEGQDGNAGQAGTQEPGSQSAQMAKQGMTQQDFEEALNREADRRVSQAQAKWVEDLTKELGTKDLSAVKSRLETLQAEAQTATARAEFTEAAHKNGISDIKGAWAIAKAENLIDDKGGVDFEKLKTEHPGLFGTSQKQTLLNRNADTGQKKGIDMTAELRKAAIG